MCIAMNKLYDDPNRLRHSVHEFYLKSPEQIANFMQIFLKPSKPLKEIAENVI